MPSTAIMQVTVKRVHETTHNNNSSMLENEKNSMVSNVRLCTKTLAIVYFKKGAIPIVLKEGMILSRVSRGVKRRNNEGRRKARKTINSKSEKESPQHQFIPGSTGAKLQNKVNIEKGSSISGNMDIIQD